MESPLTERYELLALAGRGGMGEVWRARDRASGEIVAIKRVRLGPADAHDRFARESRLLASLEHPAIVRHLANGADADGAWIAMEWLEGQDLGARIAARPLDSLSVCAIGARIADALGATHARGVIHRDVKPSNVFLEGGDPQRAKLLDFGVARLVFASQRLTATHAVVGTVGYMAPEQAGGRDDLDPRVDVFALGCVLYECFTGEPAFAGATPLAVLGKILCHDVPRLRDRNPELPVELDDLVARMLEKDRALRIASGAEVAQALRGMDLGAVRSRAVRGTAGPITGGERRVASILLARLATVADDADTMTSDAGPRGVAALAERYGARLTVLAGSHLLLALEGAGAATDRAQRAARCALELSELLGDVAVALATGGAESSGHSVLGPVVDRAALLLQRPDAPRAVLVDEATEGLLGAEGDVEHRGDFRVLRGARVDDAAIRTVLGRATPFVGRERELATLDSIWRVCVAERTASVAVVCAPPGMGKTRLRQELCARVLASGAGTGAASDATAGAASEPSARVLVVRADPFAAGSALRLSRELIRRGIGIVEEEPDAIRRRTTERVVALLGATDGAPVAELLAEILGAATESPSPRLAAARQDPRLLAEELQTAFARWLVAEATASPLLVVVEDLHWGDAASVEHLDAALRHRDVPLMLLALARPEVRETFPSPWASSSPVWIELAALSPRAAERLVRGILGADLPAATLARIVARADGNAFYLEELARFAADRADDTPPESVLAMVQARIAQLDPPLRRAARAASLFGETTWDGGVAAVLGLESPREARTVLDTLVTKEVLERARTTRYGSQVEYVFRHALVQAAAYAMLTDDDRQRGHIAAARWMVSMGDADARAIAEHFERGGAPAEAVPWLALAAHSAYTGHDPRIAIELAERAVRCGAAGTVRGELREMQGQAYGTLWQVPQALRASLEAIELLPVGTPPWVAAVAGAVFLASMGKGALPPAAAAGLPQLMAALPSLPMSERIGQARFLVEAALLRTGHVELAEQLVATRSAVGGTDGYRFWTDLAAFDHALNVDHDLGALRELSARTMSQLDRIASPVGLVMARLYHVTVLAEVGAFAELDAEIPRALADFERFGGGPGRQLTFYYAEMAARARDAPMDDASVLEIERSRAPVTALLAPCLRADRLLDARDTPAAIALVTGIEQSGLSIAGSHAHLVLSLAARRQRRLDEAVAHAAAGLAVRAHPPTLRSRLLLAHCEALRARGDTAYATARDQAVTAIRATAATAVGRDGETYLALPQQRALLALE